MVNAVQVSDPKNSTAVLLEQVERLSKLKRHASLYTVVITRQSGNEYKPDQMYDNYDDALNSMLSTFRRSCIEDVRIAENTGECINIHRSMHCHRGKAEGKKVGTGVIMAHGSIEPLVSESETKPLAEPVVEKPQTYDLEPLEDEDGDLPRLTMVDDSGKMYILLLEEEHGQKGIRAIMAVDSMQEPEPVCIQLNEEAFEELMDEGVIFIEQMESNLTIIGGENSVEYR